MKETTISREKLFNLVWEKPISVIASEYDTDHQTIIDKCIKYNIPRPKSGHWTKIRFGKEVSIPELPECGKSHTSITFSKEVLISQLHIAEIE